MNDKVKQMADVHNIYNACAFQLYDAARTTKDNIQILHYNIIDNISVVLPQNDTYTVVASKASVYVTR